MDQPRATQRYLFLAVLLVAAAARLLSLNKRVVWFDEAVTWLVARASIPEILAAAWDDTHPPLYYLALHGWLWLVPTEWGARLLSVVCGVATVMVVGMLGRALAGPRAGLAAAALMALAPLPVWYSQEMRMYAMQTLLVCASWWTLWRALDKPGRWRWVIHALVTTLGLYLQYSAAFSILAQNIFLLVLWRRQRVRWQDWLGSQLLVIGLFAPWLPYFWHHWSRQTFGGWLRPFEWADVSYFFALLTGAIQKNPGPYWPWMLLGLGSVGLAVWVLSGRRRETVPADRLNLLMLGLWFGLPLAALALVSLQENKFLPRAILYVTAPFALMLGVAVVRRPRLMLGCVVLVLASHLVALWNYARGPSRWVRSPVRSAAATVAAAYRPGELILHTSPFSYRPFQCYLDPEIRQALVSEPWSTPHLFGVIGQGALPTNWSAAAGLWLVRQADFLQEPDPGVLEAISARYPHATTIMRVPGQLAVIRYSRTADQPQGQQPSAALGP